MFDVIPFTSPKQCDCGATCMKMLLGYYGIDVPLDELIEECNTRLIGCSAGDLKRCGEKHGLDMIAYQMDADEVMTQDRPSIVWWKYGHWCVCCGLNEDGDVVICNPDRGRYHMSKNVFRSFYTRVALFNGEPAGIPEAPSTAQRVTELEDAMVELAAMSAEHEDALVELAGLIEGGE